MNGRGFAKPREHHPYKGRVRGGGWESEKNFNHLKSISSLLRTRKDIWKNERLTKVRIGIGHLRKLVFSKRFARYLKKQQLDRDEIRSEPPLRSSLGHEEELPKSPPPSFENERDAQKCRVVFEHLAVVYNRAVPGNFSLAPRGPVKSLALSEICM